jgi:predicted flavoprotein YhiN
VAGDRSIPNLSLKNSLAKILPKRLVEVLQTLKVVPDITLKELGGIHAAQRHFSSAIAFGSVWLNTPGVQRLHQLWKHGRYRASISLVKWWM